MKINYLREIRAAWVEDADSIGTALLLVLLGALSLIAAPAYILKALFVTWWWAPIRARRALKRIQKIIRAGRPAR